MFLEICVIITILMVFLYYRRSKLREKARIHPPQGISYNKQRVLVGISSYGTEIFGSPLVTETQLANFCTLDSSIHTLYDNFLRGVAVSENGECLGTYCATTDNYKWIKYKEVIRRAHSLGFSFLDIGLRPGDRTFVGIFAKNCANWVITSLACMSQSMVVVPLYDTLGPDVMKYIVDQAEIELIVCDSQDKLRDILKDPSGFKSLKHVVLMTASDAVADTNKSLLKEFEACGISLHSFHDMVFKEDHENDQVHLPTADNLYIICYTSGTTGVPKGVMLTHRNLITNTNAILFSWKQCGFELKVEDAVISYLPLAHMFEQVMQAVIYFGGSKVGFYRGQVVDLFKDIKCLKPQVFPVVPRLLNRFYDSIQQKLESAGSAKRGLFNLAYACKMREIKEGIVRRNSIFDMLVFKKIQAELGGNIRLMVTGSAPISADVLEMVRVVTGALVIEGYGQTEVAAAATLTLPGDHSGGHVGGPAICCHITLVDVPELEYWSREGRGEILIRGPATTTGYLKNPEKTAELVDEHGWISSGDIGQWMPNGTVKIIDRKKHIFKLAQGEYIAPEKIEMAYVKAHTVDQVFVDGNSLERFLVAVVVPNEAALRTWYQNQQATSGESEPTYQQLCSNKEVRNCVLADIMEVGRQAKLSGIEKVKAIYLTSEAFSIENGLLTPTMKPKRPQLRQRYKNVIDELYSNNI